MKVRKYQLKTPVKAKKYRVAYEEELNQEQQDVVFAGDGPVLVIAGAGSGKTRALTYRVARLMEDGVDPSEILLVTFTNKASREMQKRLDQLVATDIRRLWSGTFHSVGNRILRQHAAVIGYRSDFSILDDEDAKEAMETAISATGMPTLDKRFPKGDVLLDMHSYVINTRTPLELYIEQNFPHFLVYLAELPKVFAKYAERKRELNAMDYDDLLLNWKLLLDGYPEVAGTLRLKFRHILVDEYQDTNKLQAETIDLMAAGRRNLMVVGDDAQSIYSFRGASFENIISFPLRFPDATLLKLETNYRSSPQILDLANESIRNNRYQFRKELQPTRGAGPDPALVGVDDADAQASFVAQRILELRDEGVALDEIAVLYRSHYQSMELQIELTHRLIPFEIRSGMKIFEQRHIKDVVAYMRIIVNSRDELSWKRVLKLYAKIGARTAADVWTELSRSDDPLRRFLRGLASVTGRAQLVSLQQLSETLQILGTDALRRNPAEAVSIILDRGYRDYLKAEFPNYQTKLDDIEQLSQIALRYDGMDELLADFALANPMAGEETAVVGPEDEKIVLSSVHQAKGLEWRVVFVIWLADGRFPSARALRVPAGVISVAQRKVHEEFALTAASLFSGLELSPAEDGRPVEIVIPGEEEERRLFYVAVTRAKQELYLVHPVMSRDRMGMDILMEPSRFLRELPDDVYEKWVIE